MRAGQERGRVENGVGFVKKSLLAGPQLPDFAAMPPVATVWVDTAANVSKYREAKQRPIDRFEDERAHLLRLNPAGFDLAISSFRHADFRQLRTGAHTADKSCNLRMIASLVR